MKIQSFVEGFGEVEALPILLRRLQEASGAFSVEFTRPIRQTRPELTQEASLRRVVKLALLQECGGILILLDADDDCPKELAPILRGWASQEVGHLACEVVVANREYEAWFLAALESLRGQRGMRPDASYPNPPEAIRGAKEALRVAMPDYSERVDQAALTARFDLATAHRRCRSFRRMVRAFGTLAREAGADIGQWPPSAWLAR